MISENTASQVLVPPSDSVMFISPFQHVEDPLKHVFFGNRSLNILFSGRDCYPQQSQITICLTMKVNDGKIKMGKWFKHETFDYKPRNVNNTKLEHNYHGTVSRTHARTARTHSRTKKKKLDQKTDTSVDIDWPFACTLRHLVAASDLLIARCSGK